MAVLLAVVVGSERGMGLTLVQLEGNSEFCWVVEIKNKSHFFSSGRCDVWNRFSHFLTAIKVSLETQPSCGRRPNQDNCREMDSAP